MLALSILTAVYDALILAGLGLVATRALQRIRFFAGTPVWQLVLLGYGIIPALLSISGFSGINKVLPLPQLLAFLSASYALYSAYLHKGFLQDRAAAFLSTGNGRALTLASVAAVALLLVTQWCYFAGGINNFDQYRGLSFTGAFAANGLKPAHPLDFSQPLGYGYYFYEYTALLYSAVLGKGWPGVPLVVCAAFAIFSFYYVFGKFAALIVPNVFHGLALFAACAVTFYGLDFLRPVPYTVDWWSEVQITQMAAWWQWLYHYLFAAALGLASLVCLAEALRSRSNAQLVLATLFLVLTPLYAAVTGIFFICIFLLFAVLACLENWRRLLFWRYFGLSFRQAVLLALAAAVLAAPQFFTFAGRGSYLHFHWAPVFWFTREPMAAATSGDWQVFFLVLMIELGLLHFLALLLIPAFAFSLYRQNPIQGALLSSLVLVSMATLTFFEAQTFDWFWRTGNFGLMLLSAVGVVWLMSLLPLQKPFVRTAAWCGAAILFLPGIVNFYTEAKLRFDSCVPAGAEALALNKAIPLDTALAYTRPATENGNAAIHLSPGHLWSQILAPKQAEKYILHNQREVVLSLAVQAGRIAYGGDNPLWKLLDVYSLDKSVLRDRFGIAVAENPCGRSWYGAALPAQRYVEIADLQPQLKYEIRTCVK